MKSSHAREQVPRQPPLRLLQQDVLAQLPHDAAQDHSLPGLNYKKHLPEELFLPFWRMGKTIPKNLLSCSRNL